MTALDDVRALTFHIGELLPYSGSSAGRDLGILIADCESAIHFCKACDRARMQRDHVWLLDCYLRTAIQLRINALHDLNSEKLSIAKEQVAEYFDTFFEACGRYVANAVPEAGVWLAVRSGV